MNVVGEKEISVQHTHAHTHVYMYMYMYMYIWEKEMDRFAGGRRAEEFTMCQCLNTQHRWCTNTLAGLMRGWNHSYSYFPRPYIFCQSAHVNASGRDSIWFWGKFETASHWSSTWLLDYQETLNIRIILCFSQ